MRFVFALVCSALCVAPVVAQVSQAPPLRPPQAPTLQKAQVSRGGSPAANQPCRDCGCGGNPALCTCPPGGCACANGGDCRAVTGDPSVVHRDPQSGRRWHYTPQGPYNWDWLPELQPRQMISPFVPVQPGLFGGPSASPRFGRVARGGC